MARKSKKHKRSTFKERSHPTQCLGAGELSSNHLPNQAPSNRSSVASEIDTVSDFSASGRRAVISSPGHPFGRAAGTRRHGGRY